MELAEFRIALKEHEARVGGMLRASWKEELQGIRSELGALRAGLEGRPGLEQELQEIRSDMGALRGSLEGWPVLEQELQGIRSDVGALRDSVKRDRHERQVDLATTPEHKLQEGPQKVGLQSQLEQQGVSLQELPRGLARLHASPEPAGVAESSPWPPYGEEPWPPDDEETSAARTGGWGDGVRSPKIGRASVGPTALHMSELKEAPSTLRQIRHATPKVVSNSWTHALNQRCETLTERWEALMERSMADDRPKLASLAFVYTNTFQALSMLVIVANTIFMWQTVDAGVATALRQGEGGWPEEVIVDLDWVFTAFYLAECVVKLFGDPFRFFLGEGNRWNLMDVVLIISAVAELFGTTSLDVKFIRILRVLRVTRLLRMMKVMEQVGDFTLVLDMMTGSAVNLFWAGVLMYFILFLFSMFFVQGFLTSLQTGTFEQVEDFDLAEGFGSVAEGTMTLAASVTGGYDWMDVYAAVKPLGLLYTAAFIVFVAFFLLRVYLSTKPSD